MANPNCRLKITWLKTNKASSFSSPKITITITAGILSIQLGFAVIPLIHFVSDKKTMGEFAIKPLTQIVSWLVASILIFLMRIYPFYFPYSIIQITLRRSISYCL